MKASKSKIIKSDYMSMLSILIPVMTLIILIDSATLGILYSVLSDSDRQADPFIFLLIAVGACALFIPVLIIRVKGIKSLISNGTTTEGVITKLTFDRDRGRIEYDYIFNGEAYHSGNAVHKSKYVKSLKKGQKITLVVDPQKPQKALIRDMYVV